MKKKAYKKAVQPTTDRTAKAPKKGTKTKNRKSVSICQLKDIFKQFVKEQYENDCKRYKQHTQEYLKEHTDPNSILWAKQAEKDDLKAFKKIYTEQLGEIELNQPIRILEHLGVVSNNEINIDRLETAIKTFLLLVRFPKNHPDDGFYWGNVEIWKNQITRLYRFIRGGEL